ncbi:Zinc finger MYM-type protein 5 like protein [Argiope bruennichi]|uniref:Zinc finger MYM-type protein 5 like protein n=1 Tax=Argiope bruennichi TaxID=94029 RepID=A0A8T0FMP9_ARGBR|nr:Zinc finger MYM-type protein 5 like protein [Argiope bruennichi]
MLSKKDKKSGAQNRKRKLQREEANQKPAESLNKYLRNTIGLGKQATEPGSSTSTCGLEFHNENLYENVNSSEYDQEETTIVPIENLDVDVENSPGNNVISQNGDFDLELNDPATWPDTISIKIRDYLIENGPPRLITKHFPRDNSGRKFSESFNYRT